MIPIVDRPEVEHIDSPILRIDMTEMDADSIRTMLENSRDGFYSNKELAPIREYSTNARDAHIQAGKPNHRIEVTLPSRFNPELRIRDFGAGLTLEQISDVYFKYWKSTKRGTNDQNGCLGIGAKSAFAYAPSYTVVTWAEGMKTVCTGQKNGFADVIARDKKPKDELDGVEVIIPVEQKDVDKFILEATEFFKYWDAEVRPVFHNAEQATLKDAFNLLDTEPFLKGDGWSVRPSGYGKGCSRAVMGFVPYPVDWDQVQNSLSGEIRQEIAGIFEFLSENITTLTFPNGTLSFTPNREALQYNDVTVKALTGKLIEIYNSLVNIIGDKISGSTNLWEAKINYNRMFRKELDGFDKSLTYGGNLSTLERLLGGHIEWKGVEIENGYFDNLEEWDKESGRKNAGAYNSSDRDPVFYVIAKDDDNSKGVKVVKPKRWGSGKIMCSPNNIIIVNDTEKPVLAKLYARWFLYVSGKTLNNVYVLDLHNPDVKDSFFEYYNFESVPVHYVSENLETIKAYRKTLRAANSTSGGGGPARTLFCPFVSIENRNDSYRSRATEPNWKTESVNAKGIDGGVFVRYGRHNFCLNSTTSTKIPHNVSGPFWQSLYLVVKKLGLDLEKVYGIYDRTADSLWFKEAIKEGHWIALEDFIKGELDEIPQAAVKKAHAYSQIDDGLKIGTVLAKSLKAQMVDDTSPLYNFCEVLLTEIYPHLSFVSLFNLLNLDNWNASKDDVISLTNMCKQLRKRYPMIFCHGSDNAIQSDDAKGYYKLTDEEISEIVDYVNMVDLHLTMPKRVV